MALTIDSIKKLPTPKKVLVLILLLGVLAGLYYYLLFAPQQEQLAIHRDLEKFKAQVAKLQAELMVVRAQLPEEREIPEILKNISALGKENQLEFILFRPKPEEPQTHYANVPIDLTMIGNYHNIGVFFDKVSKLPRIINVVDFNMGRPQPTRGKGEVREEGKVRTSCLLNTYRFIEKTSEEEKGGKKTGAKKAGK
jgi:type IV pilus assembly protein PilO